MYGVGSAGGGEWMWWWSGGDGEWMCWWSGVMGSGCAGGAEGMGSGCAGGAEGMGSGCAGGGWGERLWTVLGKGCMYLSTGFLWCLGTDCVERGQVKHMNRELLQTVQDSGSQVGALALA